MNLNRLISRGFPLWALLIAIGAGFFPTPFVMMKEWVLPLLIAVMLGMGMTLRWADIQDVWRLKQFVGLGVGLQFLVMPMVAFILSRILELSPELTLGMMLVGTSAGGTASNVITYLAGGNVALSVSMTSVSTLAAIAFMPFLTWLYLGEEIQLPTLSMLQTLAGIILIPVVLGMTIRALITRYKPSLFYRWEMLFPSLSALAIILIVGIVVGLNQSQLSYLSLALVIGIVLHNLIGMTSGYMLSKALRCDDKTARTLAIEVGMQNSGLSVALALKYFTPLVALPGAIFSIWHNLSGLVFAAYCAAKTQRKSQK